jgi:TetR/AcrR family transcriptional regulator, transcriptional repressor for nem operon
MDGHILFMSKVSNREKILAAGLQVVHERGYAGASVRDIVQAAGVPQGSFTNHFASKEAFGLEIINLYFGASCELMRQTLRNKALPPLRRLDTFIDTGMNRLNQESMRHGCLFGNFTAEASDSSEAIRQRLNEIFGEITGAIAQCLEDAVTAGELPAGFDGAETAGFIVASLQGANLLAKAERSPVPVQRFKRILFEKILR